jgi:hypothetical protein
MPYFSQKVILPIILYIKPVINTDVMHEKIYAKTFIANVALAHLAALIFLLFVKFLVIFS